MLELNQIESFYPEHLRYFKKNLLREYLQYKILEIIFDSRYADKLVFMGGTAAHIIYGNTRFSEDLDFDNLSLKSEDFESLTALIQRELALEGYRLEASNVLKAVYSCDLKFPGLLFFNGLSAHRDEGLLIKLDTEPQEFPYQPQNIIINKFDIFLKISVVPTDILLAQKIYAIFKRKRPMGRDFYDAVFLLGRARPNMAYIKVKLGIGDAVNLKKELFLRCKALDFKDLAKDVEPFLYKPGNPKKVRFFLQYLETIDL